MAKLDNLYQSGVIPTAFGYFSSPRVAARAISIIIDLRLHYLQSPPAGSRCNESKDFIDFCAVKRALGQF